MFAWPPIKSHSHQYVKLIPTPAWRELLYSEASKSFRMDGKLIKSEMKPATSNFSARVGLWVVVVCVVCSVFLICNYLVVNQRISAMEGKLESLQRSEKPNPNVSFDDQTGAKHEHHAREKRAAKQKTQVSNIADFEKRLQALEKRYLSIFFCIPKTYLVTTMEILNTTYAIPSVSLMEVAVFICTLLTVKET